MRELAENGKPTGATRSYGFDRPRTESGSPVPGSGLEVIPQEAERIREAADRILAGESLYAVIGDWTSRGVPTVRGAAWSTTALKTILLSPRIAGLRIHRGEIMGPAEWEPILDQATWRRVGAILTDPARQRTRAKRSYFLSGLLHCASCGHQLVATPRRRKAGAGKRGRYHYLPERRSTPTAASKQTGGRRQCSSLLTVSSGW